MDLLDVRGLTTRFYTADGVVRAVEDVSFSVRDGEVFGIVGESGSGKSVTGLSLLDLVDPPGEILEGEIWFRDPDLAAGVRSRDADAVRDDLVDLRALSAAERRAVRGTALSMIFQDPTASFNPSLTVGEQIAEAVETGRRTGDAPLAGSGPASYGLGSYLADSVNPFRSYAGEESHARAVELLAEVGIPDPAERAEYYPNEFSGGMLQRAMIAQALAGEPDLLIADEPTTSLDVTIRAQILKLLSEMQERTGMSIVLISHDLGTIARMCDRVAVMYAGEVVEHGSISDVLDDPVHPYTEGLLACVPDPDAPAGRLDPIPGSPPDLLEADLAGRCSFADRCPSAMEDCLESPPEFEVPEKSDDHGVRCVLADRDFQPERELPEDYFTGVDGRG